MVGVGFDEDGLDGFGGAGVFAGTAADADLLVDDGDGEVIDKWNHLDGLGGAVFGTGAAGGVFGIDNAVMTAEPGVADLQSIFLFYGDGQYGAAGAYLGALHTFMVAVADPVIHLRLEHPREAVFEKGGL